MRTALAAPLALLTVLGAQKAMAETGRKLLENRTRFPFVVEVGIRGANGIGFLNMGERMTLHLNPAQSLWFEYKGTHLNWMTVNGTVRCDVKSRQLGDQGDSLLNTNNHLFIEASNDACVVRGGNVY